MEESKETPWTVELARKTVLAALGAPLDIKITNIMRSDMDNSPTGHLELKINYRVTPEMIPIFNETENRGKTK